MSFLMKRTSMMMNRTSTTTMTSTTMITTNKITGCILNGAAFFYHREAVVIDSVRLVIDKAVLDRYNDYYFGVHPRAKKAPIKQPYHESINTWMRLKRSAMNALKQKWKDFIEWFVNEQGYANLHIEKCELSHTIYYPSNRRHDTDNSTPKFILDGLVESGMIVDDDSEHITKLTLECFVDTGHPRTELCLSIKETE